MRAESTVNKGASDALAEATQTDAAAGLDPVLARRSIRKYTNRRVTDSDVKTLLEAAMAAPSAHDERPWHFIAIRNGALQELIQVIHPHAYMVTQASVVILVCGDKNLQKIQGFWAQDCAAATENILIEAEQLGLGAVWLGVYPIEGLVRKLRGMLSLPEHIIPFSLVAIGHPAEKKKPSSRYNEKRVHHDEW